MASLIKRWRIFKYESSHVWLTDAFRSGDFSLVNKRIVERPRYLRERHPETQSTWLHTACSRFEAPRYGSDIVPPSHVAILRCMLKHGADPNAQNVNGETPFHWAVRNNVPEYVAILIVNKADVNATTNDGRCAVHFWEGSPRMLKLLMKHGADINAQDNCGRTVLHRVALEVRDPLPRRQTLLEAGVDPAVTDRNGMTAEELTRS